MPCQVLVKRTDNRGEDGLAWKRGDPVVVRHERWVWGRREDPATSDKFFVLRIPDLDEGEATRLLLEEIFDKPPQEEDRELVRLRRYRLDIDHMPQEWGTEMEQEGRLERTRQEIDPHVRDMETGHYGIEEGLHGRGVE